jgi:acyl-CoA synthetase (AMP-forming)/AMP-acid ligase II
VDSSQDRTPSHVADLVAAAAQRHPDHPALADPALAADAGDDGALTWGAFDAAVSAEARRLTGAGVVEGDRVVVRSGGGAALAVAVLGVLRAGGVAVPLAPGVDAAPVVADCAPRLVVDTGAAADAGVTVPVVGPPDLAARGEPFAALGGREGLALLFYTSGSPRGVCLSHRAVLANRAQAAALRPAPVTPVDRVLLAQPLFHAYGLAAGLLQVCWTGATAVLPGPGKPDAEWVVDAVARQRVSALAAVPSTYRALLELPAERLREGLAGLRLCTCGVVPLPVSWATAFREATGHRIVEGYGLTEAGPVVTSTPIDGTATAGSVGRPLPGIELRLVDRDGRPLGAVAATPVVAEGGTTADRSPGVAEVRAAASRAASEVRAAAANRAAAEVRAAAGRGVAEVRAAAGRAATEGWAAVRAAQPAGDPVGDMIDDAQDVEGPADPTQDTGLIALRGPNLFSGYWPDRTGGPDADGWFRTPDIGFLDPSGDLHLVDRSTDLVVVSGFTVYPHEIERVLLEMPAVVEAAVVGVPDEKTGQAVRAVVVRAAGPDPTQPDADAVRAHCSTRLARFKVPAQVVFVDALPRTPSGKLARKELASGPAGGDR